MKKIKSVLCLLLVLLLLPTVAAAAVGIIDADKELSLTVTYRDGDTPIVGAAFSLYKVADMDAYGEMTPTKDFNALDIMDRINSDSEWKALALTLDAYVSERDIAPICSGVTDESGVLRFPADGKRLEAGLYLLSGEKHLANGNYYEPSPLLLSLPAYDSVGDKWVYDASVEPKSESTPDDTDTLDRKVIKVWDDKGFESSRPKEIKVKLLRNGEVFDTVVLNDKNNWRYEWTGLDASYTWKVSEEVPDGYSVTISLDGTTFFITNTHKSDEPKPPVKPNLPQTGQLWWPVAALGIGGLIVLTLGLLSKKRDGNE